jgi:late competence protein required for DNA uptake (superfamily II DNA/RNA helicase)
MLKTIKKDQHDLLGKFQIDLDALRIKQVQYFPFGKDSVLQINLYNP